ncbi:tlh3 [Cordyceps javanica]|nr:tlh3 [Cordyceps javanica]
MAELSGFMHAVLQEARSIIAELTMCGSEGTQGLLAIAWDDVYDDNSNDAVGYTFIKDDRNTLWVKKGKGYIKQHPYREKKANEYGRVLDRFREKLLVLMHMVSGQPARATEILTVRMENTANAGTWNIFVSHGQMCFVTAYHKNFQ